MTEQTSEAQGQQAQQQIPSFTPDDLVVAVQLIDEAVGQGAFRSWELLQKASVNRGRLVLFAQHWQNTINAASEQTLAEAAGTAPQAEAAVEEGE